MHVIPIFMIAIVVFVLVGVFVFVVVIRALAGLFIGQTNQSALGQRRPSGAIQIAPLPHHPQATTVVPPAPAVAPAGARVCSYELCRSPNDASAQFCRRCGRELAPVPQARARHAAVW